MADSSSTSTEITSRCRCITDHVTATFDYKLANYLQLKGMGVGKSVSSPVFTVGGYDWKIKFYPDGWDIPDYASCFLTYLGQAKGVSAIVLLSIVDTNGEEIASDGMEDQFDVFNPGRKIMGYHQFVDRSKLKSMSRAGDGCFTIRCVLTVRTESPPLELPGHLERMLGDRIWADVTFSVGGEELCAHRSLLAARSPILKAQLFGPMAEKDMKHVVVIDMEPAIFEIILHYIYTDSMPPCRGDGGGYTAPVMQHLLVAADRYGLDRLKDMCEKELCKKMDAETVTTTLALADQHQCERLKKACLAFKKRLKTRSRPRISKKSVRQKRKPSIC